MIIRRSDDVCPKRDDAVTRRKWFVGFAMLCVIAFVAGFVFYPYFPPDPAYCPFRNAKTPYNAPVLLDLSTGEMIELRVYQNDPARPGELAPAQRTGYMQTIQFEDNQLVINGGQNCYITLPPPAKWKRMKRGLYCCDMRAEIERWASKGYVVLDMKNHDDIAVFPISLSDEYEIGDYMVSFDYLYDGSVRVICVGLLDFQWYDA